MGCGRRDRLCSYCRFATTRRDAKTAGATLRRPAPYGLDVQIISPPHMVLALGIVAITLGALLLTLARQNQTTGREQEQFAALFTIAAAFWLMNVWVMLSEYSYKEFMHGGLYYRVAATYYPLVLLTTSRANTLTWPATKAATVYMLGTLVLMWTPQIIPAEPTLGPS